MNTHRYLHQLVAPKRSGLQLKADADVSLLYLMVGEYVAPSQALPELTTSYILYLLHINIGYLCMKW